MHSLPREMSQFIMSEREREKEKVLYMLRDDVLSFYFQMFF